MGKLEEWGKWADGVQKTLDEIYYKTVPEEELLKQKENINNELKRRKQLSESFDSNLDILKIPIKTKGKYFGDSWEKGKRQVVFMKKGKPKYINYPYFEGDTLVIGDTLFEVTDIVVFMIENNIYAFVALLSKELSYAKNTRI